jgi:hypothetical protein
LLAKSKANTFMRRQIPDIQLVVGRRKHIPVNTRMTDVFYGSASRLYNEDLTQFPLEAGSNTSAVALRVVGGDRKGTQCLAV